MRDAKLGKKRGAMSPETKGKIGGANRHEYCKRGHLMAETRVTFQEIEALFANQVECAICGAAPPLYIDHDHDTGKVRMLLCSRCNLSIGAFEDSSDLLRRAAFYLESFGK